MMNRIEIGRGASDALFGGRLKAAEKVDEVKEPPNFKNHSAVEASRFSMII
jgi:hypothetical protein